MLIVRLHDAGKLKEYEAMKLAINQDLKWSDGSNLQYVYWLKAAIPILLDFGMNHEAHLCIERAVKVCRQEQAKQSTVFHRDFAPFLSNFMCALEGNEALEGLPGEFYVASMRCLCQEVRMLKHPVFWSRYPTQHTEQPPTPYNEDMAFLQISSPSIPNKVAQYPTTSRSSPSHRVPFHPSRPQYHQPSYAEQPSTPWIKEMSSPQMRRPKHTQQRGAITCYLSIVAVSPRSDTSLTPSIPPTVV